MQYNSCCGWSKVVVMREKMAPGLRVVGHHVGGPCQPAPRRPHSSPTRSIIEVIGCIPSLFHWFTCLIQNRIGKRRKCCVALRDSVVAATHIVPQVL